MTVENEKFSFPVIQNGNTIFYLYSPAMLLVSEIFFQGLSQEHKDIIISAATAARDFERNLSIEGDKTTEAKLVSEGMIVSHPDKAEFVKAVAPPIRRL